MKKENKRNILIVGGAIILALLVLALALAETSAVIVQTPEQPPKREMEVAVEIIREQPVKSKVAKATPPAPAKNEVPTPNVASAKGALPPVSANYRKNIGFKRYAREMIRRGAKFLIFGGSAKRLYEIDLQRQTLKKIDIKQLVKGKYSPRSRVIFDEPALNIYLKLAKDQYNITVPEVHLLAQRGLDEKVAAALKKNNIQMQNISGLNGIYEYSDKGVFILRLNQALTDRGGVKLDIAVEL